MIEKTLWGIHAGKTGDADTLFLKQKRIALGWAEMGDLTKLKPDREAFKARVAQCYPEAKPGAIPNNAGQLFRFVHEMKSGDFVAYPSKQSRKIYLGRVTGNYKYDPAKSTGYPNARSVEWLQEVPRTKFSQGALHEIGSAMSFFQIKNYAEEFHAAIDGTPVTPSVQQDETVGLVAEEIEETTRDFILKTLAQQLKGHAFAHFVGHLLQRMGYHTRISPKGPDGGIDIIAHKDELGFEPPIVKVQVKSTEGSIGNPQVAELYGNVSAQEFGLFVTLGNFTSQALGFAKGKPNLRLIDGEELVRLVLTHYDRFDSAYKSVLPLRRVHIPDAVNDEEGQ
jgi:restriction system protein